MMYYTSTFKTIGLVIVDVMKLCARRKSRNEPKRSSVLPEKEPNERRRQQKPRGHGEWQRIDELPERKSSAREKERRK